MLPSMKKYGDIFFSDTHNKFGRDLFSSDSDRQTELGSPQSSLGESSGTKDTAWGAFLQFLRNSGYRGEVYNAIARSRAAFENAQAGLNASRPSGQRQVFFTETLAQADPALMFGYMSPAQSGRDMMNRRARGVNIG